jgi:hypothetical protein
MNEEARKPQESTQPLGTGAPAAGTEAPGKLPEYRIPAPPIPGKIAWSISPWLPE